MGIQIAKKEQKLGIRASSTCTISFDDVKIPEENVIGGVGQGYKVAIEILNEGRIGIAGQMLGLAQGAFDKAVPYTYERKQFGQPIGHFQGMQFQIAQAAIEIEAARLLTYNAARRKEEGKNFTKEAAMAKFYSSQVAQRVAGSAIEWAGGVGFTRETGIEKFWRDSKIVSDRVVRNAVLLRAPVHQRAPFMKGHRIFSCRLSLRSSRWNTRSAFTSGLGTHCSSSHFESSPQGLLHTDIRNVFSLSGK